MTCPACKPDAQCSACLMESVALRQREQQLKTMLSKKPKGRPRKPKGEKLVSLHVSVHPLFPAFLDAATALGRGEAIEQAFGFVRPAAGQMVKEKT